MKKKWRVVTLTLGVLLELQGSRLLWAQDSMPIVQGSESNPSTSETLTAPESEEKFLWGDGKITSVAKRDQTIGEVANSISIVTREDIEASGATTLVDLFAFLPGVQLFYRNGNEPEVIVRGMTKQYSPRLLVLVDGVTVYDPFTSGVFWYGLPITVDSLERVEIIRGPASVVYGANAFSGVINFITRKPENFSGVQVKGFAGNLGNYGASATTLFPAGDRGHFRFSGEYFQSHGFGADNGNEQDDPNHTGTVMADGFIDLPHQSKLRLGAWYRRANINLPSNNIAPAALIGSDDIYALAQFDAPIGKSHQLKFHQFFHQGNHYSRENLFAINDYNLNKYDLLLEDNWNWRDRNYLMVGANYRYNGLKDSFLIASSLGNRVGLHLASFYFNDEFKISDKVILTGGARYEYDSFTKSDWSGRFNVSWLPHPDHVLRVSVARAIRSITFFEEKEDVTFPLTPEVQVIVKGNPGLDPEEMFSAEFGYIGNFLDRRLRFSFDFFYNDVNDLVLPTATPQPPNLLLINNEDLGDTKLFGFEYGVKYRIFDWWDFTFDHSFLHQNNDISGRGPANIVNVGNRFKTKVGFSANLAFNWTDNYTVFDVGAIARRNIGDLYRLDLRLAQKFLKDRLEFAVVGQGLFDYPRVEFEDSLRVDGRLFGTLTYRH